ncbi:MULTISPECIES: hypothetical protein [unclassified Streptomyces]|uniref:hypothetical protein n=1 Tax=unclassified Streptomyces TaxID=2593676 RepID=UPI00074AE6FD|nr:MULTISPECIES: hypothetical protein [unclassified Streptomyces]KUL68547.1 hypothetical protein ADL34_32645 [Streptomyces sp. NRRL WC-3605]KUL73529.1 hypothetical protein ADL33_20250 [Streptomyces sp. NRRL WC-3604]
MSSVLPFVMCALFGALVAAVYLNERQGRLAARFLDGRRIAIPCRISAAGSERWVRGSFVIASGVWSWERHPSHVGGPGLPSDARLVRVRKPDGRERNRLHHRALVVECASGEGEFRLALVPGQVEHVVMVLAPAG